MRTLFTPARRRNTLIATCLALIVASATLVSAPAVADGVTVVDPQTGHRVRLPDNDRDGRADYVPKRLDVHVSPGLTYPRETREQRPSGGGSICHGNDGGSTLSTARRNCDPTAPAGDGGAQDAPGTATNSPSTPTRPSSSSSTQLN
ncbi:hypothetical protein [Salinicola sp. CR57]|uniref:hypothetical protein n=1 Tax=Salinicola sp. CR57 TaxID=1949086 RepID=UPI000DA11E47|nr:hypothetical protein [Salinicola sp. CR57]